MTTQTRTLRPTKDSQASLTATLAPIMVAGRARTRWAPAPRPVLDDWSFDWEARRELYVVKRAAGTKGVTYWWVLAEPGETATQGCVLVAEGPLGAVVMPVPPRWRS